MNNRKILFRIIAILLPVALFVFLELFLRIFNFFPQSPLFLKKSQNGKSVLEINSYVGKRYFDENKMPVPTLYPQTFSSEKSENTFRLFCLGGSTTAGFPYEMNVPFPQQLQFLLDKSFPEKNVEVVNLGLSAINSFTVLDWISEVLEQKPDLILIYMGHNEYYGAYGAGSAISLGNSGAISRFVLKMNKFRIIQMLKSFIGVFTSASSASPNQTLMEKIIANRSIPADSELRDITHKNFTDNLGLILEACKKNSTPVIISNVVSNLKDQRPLGSSSNMIPDSLSAALVYEKGLLELERQDSVKAYSFFARAKDLDNVPFRADKEINSIIVEKATLYKAGFVNMYQVFRNSSPYGIPGDNLFCDHLHPTPEGYRIIANQFFAAIQAGGFISSEDIKADNNTEPLFVTSVDWEIGAIKIFKLKQRWPFGNRAVNFSDYEPYDNEVSAATAKDFVFNHRNWGKAHSDMADYYINSGNYAKAGKEFEAIIAMFPQSLDIHKKLLIIAKRTQSWSLLEKTCKKALMLSNNKGLIYNDLALSQRMSGRFKEAIQSIQMAIASPELTKDELARSFYYLAILLKDTGDIVRAKEVLAELIKQTPEFDDARILLKKLQN